MTKTKWQEVEKEFDKRFPPFRGVGSQFPIFRENPNRNHILLFLRSTLKRFGKDMINTITPSAGWNSGTEYDNGYRDGYSQSLREIRNRIKEWGV